jgi:hypothetical protein
MVDLVIILQNYYFILIFTEFLRNLLLICVKRVQTLRYLLSMKAILSEYTATLYLHVNGVLVGVQKW